MVCAFFSSTWRVRCLCLFLLGMGGAWALACRTAWGAAESKDVGRYVPSQAREPASVLLKRGQGKSSWQRLDGAHPAISTGDTLVALPGYRSEVRFGSGLRLLMCGELPELSYYSLSLESVVEVRDPGKRELDLRLDRGRIVLTNEKANGPARVRIRFANVVAPSGEDSWEIVLPKKGTEAALELWGRYPPDVPFTTEPKKHRGPTRELYLFVVKGPVTVQVDDTTYGMEQTPGAGMLLWNSRQGTNRPPTVQKLPEWITQRYPPFPKGLSKEATRALEESREKMRQALSELSQGLRDQDPKVVLEKGLEARDSSFRILAVRGLGAINDIAAVVDALTAKNHADVRQTAVVELRHWIGLAPDNDLALHALLIKQKKLTPKAAAVFVELLHTFSEEDLDRPETYARLIDYLRHDAPAIRVLAHWHLVRLVPEGDRIPFNPLGNAPTLDSTHAAWKKLVPEGRLPRAPVKPEKEQ